ncbi:MAG: BfmA/BtgA family mobilization protein [Cellulophaga sp.]
MPTSKERAVVKLSLEAKNQLVILAKKHNKTELDYVSTAIQYLYKTGLNVYSTSVPNIPDLLKSLENRVIGFMKKREQDFFLPMKGQVQSLTENHVKLFDSLNALDIIKFATENVEKKDNKFTVSEPQENDEIEVEKEEIKPVAYAKENETFLIDENLKGELEKANTQKKIFKDELNFLIQRISKSGALSGNKFNLNITQRDFDRIEKIVNDN